MQNFFSLFTNSVGVVSLLHATFHSDRQLLDSKGETGVPKRVPSRGLKCLSTNSNLLQPSGKKTTGNIRDPVLEKTRIGKDKNINFTSKQALKLSKLDLEQFKSPDCPIQSFGQLINSDKIFGVGPEVSRHDSLLTGDSSANSREIFAARVRRCFVAARSAGLPRKQNARQERHNHKNILTSF